MNSARIVKSFFVSLVLISATATASAADVGVSVNIGQPGFYGRLDIGDFPQPRVVYNTPVIIQRQVEVYDPIYLRVPPGHSKNWKNYCGRYQACGRPVYFVQDSWYQNEYAPAYRERHSKKHGHGGGDKHHGNDKGKGGKGKD